MGSQHLGVRGARPPAPIRRPIPRDGETDGATRGGSAATSEMVSGAPVAGGSSGLSGGVPAAMFAALQGVVGNHAVTGLITAQRETAVLTARPASGPGGAPASATDEPAAPTPANPYGALDDPDFNAEMIMDDLVRAIDQSDYGLRMKSTHWGFSMEEDVERERRKIDVPKVISALSNRTASQIQEIKRRYAAYEHSDLETDLLGKGQSNREADITNDQRWRIQALLKGTKPDPIAAPLQDELAKYPLEVATQLRKAMADKSDAIALKNRIEADTIELHELFQKKLTDETRERVMAIHRRPVLEIEAIDAFYNWYYGVGQLYADFEIRLDGLQRTRLDELRMGNPVQADAVAIEDKRRQIEALNTRDEGFTKDTWGKLAGATMNGKAVLEADEASRRKLTSDIENIVELNKREAMADTKQAAGVAVQKRMQAILGLQDGDVGHTVGSELARTLGPEHAAAITATADPWLTSGSASLITATAYRLAAMERDHTTKATWMIETLRSFPELARHDLLARVRDPSASVEEKERIGADITGSVRRLSIQYVEQYQSEYERIRGTGRPYDDIVKSATHDADSLLLKDLARGGGHTGDPQELQHAVAMEDVAAVKAILKRQPNREAIEKLAANYAVLTDGRDLEGDLFGRTPYGNVNPGFAEAAEKTRQTGGLVVGRDAAQVLELLRKPTAEELSGKETIGIFGIKHAPGEPEIEWMASGGEVEYQLTMQHRGVTGHVREWTGDPETEQLLKKTRALMPELVKQWQAATEPVQKRHLFLEIQKARATLSGDADAYEADNARLLAEIQGALQFAVSIALAVAIPGAGAGLVAFLESTALNIAATVASNFVIKGGDYGWSDLKGDVLGGVLAAGGAKFGEGVLGKVAGKVFGPAATATTEAAGKLGIESALAREAGAAIKATESGAIAIEEFETKAAAKEAAGAIAGEEKAAVSGAKGAGERPPPAAEGPVAGEGPTPAGEGSVAGERPGAPGEGPIPAKGGAPAAEGPTGAGAGPTATGAGGSAAAGSAAAAPAMSAGEKWARELGGFFGGMEAPKVLTGDYGITLDEFLKGLVTLGAGKAANHRREAIAAKKRAAAAKENTAAEPGKEGTAAEQSADERAEQAAKGTEEPVRDTESEQIAREGQEELAPGEDGKPRAAAAPAQEPSPLNKDAFGPRTSGEMLLDNGIQPDSAQALQALANDRNLVIKARPTNVASLPTVTRVAPEGGGRPVAPGLPKPEFIKAKSLNRVDMLIGGPVGQEGKIGFFEPTLPSREILDALTPEARRAVEDRAAQRQEEYDHHKDEYADLAREGLVRVKDGVLQVADPRSMASEDAPRGQFKDVGGDIDIYDITHGDGSKLTTDERAAITNAMRAMGIDVEHGFHTAWPEDSSKTYSPEADEKIRAEHTDKTPLVAFVPLTPPTQAWANDVVVGPKRTEGPGDRHLPLKGARVVNGKDVPPTDAPGTGPDIKEGETDFGDVVPKEPGKHAEGPGAQVPQEPIQGSDGSGGGPGRKGPVVDEVAPHLLPEETVIQLADARNGARHREIFEEMMAEDPTREVGLYRNPRTGEWIIVQGGPTSIGVEQVNGKLKAPAEGGKKQRWKEILDQGSDVGHWELDVHNHPSGRSLPSIADFRSIIESSMRDNLPRESRIRVKTKNGFEEGSFAFEPGNEEPYVVRPVDEPPLRFATAEEYQNYLEHRYHQEGGEIPQWLTDYENQLSGQRRRK